MKKSVIYDGQGFCANHIVVYQDTPTSVCARPPRRFDIFYDVPLNWWFKKQWSCRLFHTSWHLYVRFIPHTHTKSDTWRSFGCNQGLVWDLKYALCQTLWRIYIIAASSVENRATFFKLLSIFLKPLMNPSMPIMTLFHHCQSAPNHYVVVATQNKQALG